MCFFIQSCEPLGGGKKGKKKMHIIPSWALCPTCLPFLPALRTPQLTETCQWPTCMCWRPKSHHGISSALTCWDRGKVLPLLLAALETPLGAGADLCCWSRLCRTRAAGASPSAPCHPHCELFTPQPQLPTPCPTSRGSPGAGRMTRFS